MTKAVTPRRSRSPRFCRMLAGVRGAADVVIVGGGPAGIIVASELLERGLRATVLEAGPRPVQRDVPPIEGKMWRYTSNRAFDWMRVRALGGRALTWGGWSYRFPQQVFSDGGWPVTRRALDPHYAAIERRIGVCEGVVDDRYRRAARELDLKVIAKRGARVHGRPWTPLDAVANVDVRTEHVAITLEHGAGRATGVVSFDGRAGRYRVFRASCYVLAASAIETARILLGSGVEHRAIGRGLVDHLIAGYVLLEPKRAPSAARRGAFAGAALIPRFVNTSTESRRPYRGGFSVELDGPHAIELLDAERRETLGIPLGEADWSFTLIHAIGEMFPTPKRFVDLGTEHDALGRAVPNIHLVTTRDDRAMAADMRRACVTIADAIAVPGSSLVPTHDALDPSNVGHEAGTCRMGDDDTAPCDASGRLRPLQNVWVADAAAMPTGGDRHPTLTLLAHARRVAIDVRRHVA